MKKLILVALVNLVFTVCGAQEKFEIKGSVNGLQNGKVCVLSISKQQIDTLIQADVQNGKFEFTGEVEEPTLVGIVVKDGPRMPCWIFLENASFTVQLDANDATLNRVEGGGVEQSILRKKDEIALEIGRMRVEANRLMAGAKTDEERDSIQQLYSRASMNEMKAKLDLIKAYPDANASAQIAMEGMTQQTKEFVKEKYNLLSDKGKMTKYGRQMTEYIAYLDRINSEVSAPDFALKDADGNTFRLSDAKGKVKVIVFWEPAKHRTALRKLLATYSTYHERGVEFITIPLKENSEWAKMVKEDNFPWKQGSDWQNGKSEVVKLFGGNFIRFVYVLDENNKLLSCTKNVDTLPGYLAKIVK